MGPSGRVRRDGGAERLRSRSRQRNGTPSPEGLSSCAGGETECNREPEDRLTDDRAGHSEKEKTADQGRESGKPHSVRGDERRRHHPKKAEKRENSALGEEIERRVMSLEIRGAVDGRMRDILWRPLLNRPR